MPMTTEERREYNKQYRLKMTDDKKQQYNACRKEKYSIGPWSQRKVAQ